MLSFRQFISFLRWRVIFVRYITMIPSIRWSRLQFGSRSTTEFSKQIAINGYHPGHSLTPELVEEIRQIYVPRIDKVIPTPSGAPFINLLQAEDIHSEDPVVRLAFSKEILDLATDYYSGSPLLSTIQVLYAWPVSSDIRESQKWHKDYSDAKSLHCMIYLNDVLSPADGPFVFVDKQDSSKIRRSPILRRIDDLQFGKELGSGIIRYFYGEAGSTMFVDPSPLYHYAHRTDKPHLGIFITFSTLMPYAQPIPIIQKNAAKLLNVALELRPDLSKDFLQRLLQVE
jgi:hypothetical protein